MTFRLGLTGSIGMGKSTTAQMFRDAGHPVWDADEAVHRLYGPQGAAVAPVAAAFPAAMHEGGIDRKALKAAIAADPAALDRLSAIVHPIVAADRDAFVARHKDAPLVVLDIPLLYENGYQALLDGVAVVSADADTQRRRVMSRPGMTDDLLALILSRQMPDAEKRTRADWIIPTDTLDDARRAVNRIAKEIADRA
ncbi:dephospho-CoA kinase [Paracoccus sediminis]|uniref:Dephospho-CoA kinase n=1 Tax=Paracoccus sediminis TaxID=1214787 RepID=A0A238VFX6_9RHOB|nr:dephospho-CoA kinase [Paracoccus sediminis]TBN52057.1 dephospho-CoA kinase [Paracoccus sediminis]SNR33295.1 dephospho-CoA kinase [Paracoccus sediminis]